MKVITNELLKKFFNKLSDIFAKKQHTHTKSEVGLSNVDNTADANKNVKYATSAGSANMLTGFYQANRQGWGNQIGTFITGMDDSSGGSIAFRRDNPITGELSAIIDGRWYQNEGQYMCLDTDNYKDYCVGKNGDGASGTWKINITGSVNGHTVNSDVPENAVFTDTKTTVVNNLTTTTPGSALDAVQGKALNDSITSLSSNMLITKTFLINPGKGIEINSPHDYYETMTSRCPYVFKSDIIEISVVCAAYLFGSHIILGMLRKSNNSFTPVAGTNLTSLNFSVNTNGNVVIKCNDPYTLYFICRYNPSVTTITETS